MAVISSSTDRTPAPTSPLLAYLARLGPTSRVSTRYALRRAARLLSGGAADEEHLPWTAVRYEHVVALRQVLGDRKYRPGSIAHTLASVRGVLAEAWRLGQVPADQYLRVKDVPPPRGLVTAQGAGRMLSRSELEQVFAACDGTPWGARSRALLALLYGAGLRLAEALGLDLEDVRRDGLHVRAAKGGYVAMQPLPGRARAHLRPWFAVRGKEPGPLFVPLHARSGVLLLGRRVGLDVGERICTQLAQLAQVHSFTPHDLRRTYLSQLLDAGVELRVVQTLARHRSVVTTQRYDRRDLRALGQQAGRLPLP